MFITKEPEKLILNLLKKNNISDKKIIIIQARRNEVPVLLSLSKVSIFFIKPVFSKKASSPTKMGEIMSMGIPIICNAGTGDTDKIINDTKTGFIIDKLNNDEYGKAIDSIESLLSISHKKIRETAIKYFSIDKAIESYNNIYEIVGEK
jgi:glycosyltransferase involved in cell wall biosynthesis